MIIVPSVQKMVDLNFNLYMETVSVAKDEKPKVETHNKHQNPKPVQEKPGIHPLLSAINKLRKSTSSFIAEAKSAFKPNVKHLHILESRIYQYFQKDLKEISSSEILMQACSTYLSSLSAKDKLYTCLPLEDRIKEYGFWLGEYGTIIWNSEDILEVSNSIALIANFLCTCDDMSDIIKFFSPKVKYAGVSLTKGTLVIFFAEDVITKEEKKKGDVELEAIKKIIACPKLPSFERAISFRWTMKFQGRGVDIKTITKVINSQKLVKDHVENKHYIIYKPS